MPRIRKFLIATGALIASGMLVFALGFHVVYIPHDSEYISESAQGQIERRVHVIPKAKLTFRFTYLTFDELADEVNRRQEFNREQGMAEDPGSLAISDPVLLNLFYEMARTDRWNFSEDQNGQ